MERPLESLPRRIFLDSCTAQALRDYGGYVFEGEAVSASDRIHRVTNGLANLDALRLIFLVNERSSFEWIVSQGSLEEARMKRDPGTCNGFGTSPTIPRSAFGAKDLPSKARLARDGSMSPSSGI
jgi:hypothetical protein